MAEDKKEQKMDLSISEEVAKGVYSNLAILSHSENEFFVDFAALSPGIPKAVVRSRVIMTPVNAKRCSVRCRTMFPSTRSSSVPFRIVRTRCLRS